MPTTERVPTTTDRPVPYDPSEMVWKAAEMGRAVHHWKAPPPSPSQPVRLKPLSCRPHSAAVVRTRVPRRAAIGHVDVHEHLLRCEVRTLEASLKVPPPDDCSVHINLLRDEVCALEGRLEDCIAYQRRLESIIGQFALLVKEKGMNA